MKTGKKQVGAVCMEGLEGRVLLSLDQVIIEPCPNNIAVVPCMQPMGHGSIDGRVFDDVNGNGVMDAEEKAVAGAYLSIDPVPRGAFSIYPIMISDSEGQFHFGSLPEGEIKIRAAGGLFVTMDVQEISVTLGEGEAKNVDIAGNLYTSIWGRVLQDRGSAPKDSAEGLKVYVDSNNNGKRDDGEPWKITDSNGRYFFDHIPAGELTIGIDRLRPHTRLVKAGSGVAVRGQIVHFSSMLVKGPAIDRKGGNAFDCRLKGEAGSLRSMMLCATRGERQKPDIANPLAVPPSLVGKVDQMLWNAIRYHFHPERFPSLAGLGDAHFSRFDGDDRVQVYIFTNGESTPHVAGLESMGIAVDTSVDVPGFRVIQGLVSVKQIRKLNKLVWVRSITLPAYGFNNK